MKTSLPFIVQLKLVFLLTRFAALLHGKPDKPADDTEHIDERQDDGSEKDKEYKEQDYICPPLSSRLVCLQLQYKETAAR